MTRAVRPFVEGHEIVSCVCWRLATGWSPDNPDKGESCVKGSTKGWNSSKSPAIPVARRVGLLTALSLAVWIGLERNGLAWGRVAHRACSKLAESRLSPQARVLVRELLEPGESLADASTWADENSREIPGSAAWHYVNVPVSHDHYSPRDCRPSGCVVSKIAEFRAVLLDPRASRAKRRTALRFLVHFIEDVHQPLHVADRDDRGGNALQLRFGRYDATNLHQLWDTGLLRERFRNEDELARELKNLANGPEARGWSGKSVVQWADESLALGRQAYLDPGTGARLRNGDAVSRVYERTNAPKAALRLAQAGVRLADVLNEVLAEHGAHPVARDAATAAPR